MGRHSEYSIYTVCRCIGRLDSLNPLNPYLFLPGAHGRHRTPAGENDAAMHPAHAVWFALGSCPGWHKAHAAQTGPSDVHVSSMPVNVPPGHEYVCPLPSLLSTYPSSHVCVHAGPSVARPSQPVAYPGPLGTVPAQSLAVQSSTLVLPVAAAYLPTGHSTQSAPPVACALYCPAVQGTHPDAPTSMNAPTAVAFSV